MRVLVVVLDVPRREAFDAQPFLDLLTAYGSPWGLREHDPVSHQPLS